jgi:hypothetical protein
MAEASEQVKTTAAKGWLKTALMVVLLLAIEAGAIVGTMFFLGTDNRVATTEGADLPDLEPEAGQRIVEILVLDEKLANAKTGVTYLYDTEIYVQVRQLHADIVTSELAQFTNEIKADIGAIWRTSEPQHFQEPKLENLTRKVYALLYERFGNDPDTGEPILVKCVIVMGTGFRVDS